MMTSKLPNLRERQVAEFFGVSVKTVQSWRQKGTGPAYHKTGRAVRYALNDLQEFAQSRKIQARC